MKMAEVDLFLWWAASISGGSVFLTLVSIYLYINSRSKRKDKASMIKRPLKILTDFVFVWVLLGLLVFYIVSIDVGSAAIFAVGNIIVEILLLVYLVKNRQTESSSSS
jgi:O-antigen/teichoic acid export membrane protein